MRTRRLRERERELERLLDERTRALRAAGEQLREARTKNDRLLGHLRNLRRLGALELEAQEKVARLLESSPAGAGSLGDWSEAVGAEIAAAIGATAIGVWEVGREGVTPLVESGIAPPDRAALEGLVSALGEGHVETDSGIVVPVLGTSGELCGVLVVQGSDVAWGDTERRLVAGFARQLGGTLEMARMRRRLEAAEARRAATRLEMQERGIATLQVCERCDRCYDHTVKRCAFDGTALESPRPLPYRLLGRYRFLRLLGQGGMGVVFSARDEKLGRDVAVKLVRPEHWSNPDVKHRFEREARIMASVQHPGVVSLHDSGELEDGTAFLVMERLAGCDLKLLVLTLGRGTPAQVARLVRQGAAALGAAHLSGVVHRDVKPENVFLVDDAEGFRVKIVDFGLARSRRVERGLTHAGTVLGTPVYMAPEQLEGGEVDARVDVYSLAAVAYEVLTGRPVVAARDLGQILVHVLNTMPPKVSELVPAVPSAVDEAFESALSKDPARRPRDIELWGSSLAGLLERVPPDPQVVAWPGPAGSYAGLRDVHEL